ncbi:hypothetical protein [Aliiroseovarius sp.]|uniref:hypothetical protein n=1 Tax=Aliiroseovarius sp. TaxID=1872442 RepID=UPI00262632CB|nr:hypothetical protein [Aliiroseovarius sp.]
MSIPFSHSSLVIDEITYDLSHLTAFAAAIPGKGVGDQKDLGIVVVSSNHVFTERAKHGEKYHLNDHHGTKRVFDHERYQFSKKLRPAIQAKIESNDLTFVSRSYGGIDNLVFVEDDNGKVWTVVFCLHPVGQPKGIRMEILSAHPKVINQRKIARNHLSVYARRCIYEGLRTPKV